MDIFDVIRDRKKQAVFNMILEEACRQWCCFIDDAPERKDGEGFAQFFFEIFEGKKRITGNKLQTHSHSEKI